MGKGSDSFCNETGMSSLNPVLMNSPLTDGSLDAHDQDDLDAIAFDQEITEAAGGWDKLSEAIGKGSREEIERARKVENKIKESAKEALEKLRTLHAEGASDSKIRSFYNRQVLRQAKILGDYLDGRDDIFPAPLGYDAGEDLLHTLPEKILYAATRKRLYEPSGKPDLEFQEKFMNSPEFIRNLKRVLAQGTAASPIDKAVAGKEMEIAYRRAALLTVGINDGKRNTGRWTSPDGTEYTVEVMREFSGTALMDLIIAARPVDGDTSKVYTMQWKSYQTTAAKGSAVEAFKERNSRSIKIAELTSLTPSKRRSVQAAADEVQLRFLATNTFSDTSAHNQLGTAGFTEMITHTTRLSDPDVHRAIVTAKDLHKLFKPIVKSDGSHGPMEAVIYDKRQDGEELTVKIKTEMFAKLDDKGQPVKKRGQYVIAENDAERGDKSKGASQKDSNSGKISIDISHSGWHRLHSFSLRNRTYAESIAEAAETNPGVRDKLQQRGFI